MTATIDAGSIRPGGWTVGSTLSLLLLNAIGVVAVLLAWWATAGTLSLGSAVAWLTAGIGGLLLAASADLAWLVAVRRAVAERRADLTRRLAPALASVDGTATLPVEDASEALVASPSMTRFHLASCPLAAGKPVRAATRRTHERAKRQPCGVCQP